MDVVSDVAPIYFTKILLISIFLLPLHPILMKCANATR